MTCGKVVYHVPGNEFVSSYCGLPEGHTEPCRVVPMESIIQICKKILIQRGEVVAVVKELK